MISIVIPAYNEEKNIVRCLDAIRAQKTDEEMDVIIVDNASTDRTAAIVRKYAQQMPLRLVSEKRRGRGRARHTGFGLAKGTVVFSTDADTFLPPQWVEACLRVFRQKPGVVAVTGIPQIFDCTPAQNAIFNETIPHFLRMNYVWLGHPGLSGFGFAVKKKIYDRAGGFDPKADAYEDLDLANRVSKFGKIVLLSRPRITFSGRRFRDGMIKGWFEYLKTFAEKFVMKKRRVILKSVE